MILVSSLQLIHQMNQYIYMVYLQGFQAIIDTKGDYPTVTRKTTMIRPGHMVNGEIYAFCYVFKWRHFCRMR